MRRITMALLAGALVTTAAACGSSSSDSGGAGFQSSVQGTWLSLCNDNVSSSENSTVVISGTNFTTTVKIYSNATCSGTGTVSETITGSFTIGSSVSAGFGSGTVTAWQIDGTSSAVPGTSYDLFYIDTGASPNRMYTGDTSGANDGSTPAKRPTAIDTTFWMVKQ